MKFKVIAICAVVTGLLYGIVAWTGIRVITLSPHGNVKRTVIAAAPFSYRPIDDVYAMCARRDFYSEWAKLDDAVCADRLTQTIYTSNFVLTIFEDELRQF